MGVVAEGATVTCFEREVWRGCRQKSQGEKVCQWFGRSEKVYPPPEKLYYLKKLKWIAPCKISTHKLPQTRQV